jgi:DNA-binding CsgD family transcriptional regulator
MNMTILSCLSVESHQSSAGVPFMSFIRQFFNKRFFSIRFNRWVVVSVIGEKNWNKRRRVIVMLYRELIRLTKREQECLYYYIRGYTCKLVAKKLELSHRTVENYMENVKAKFDCHSKSELIIRAIEVGFFTAITMPVGSQKLSV